MWADTETSVTQVFLWKCFYFEDKKLLSPCFHWAWPCLQRNFTQQPPLLESSTSQRRDATCIHQREQCIMGLWFCPSKAAAKESMKFIKNWAKSRNVLIVINCHSTKAKLSMTDAWCIPNISYFCFGKCLIWAYGTKRSSSHPAPISSLWCSGHWTALSHDLLVVQSCSSHWGCSCTHILHKYWFLLSWSPLSTLLSSQGSTTLNWSPKRRTAHFLM